MQSRLVYLSRQARGEHSNSQPTALGTTTLITDTNRIYLVLYGMHNRTLGPYLAANGRILISAMFLSTL
jgi:hypothetical protein